MSARHQPSLAAGAGASTALASGVSRSGGQAIMRPSRPLPVQRPAGVAGFAMRGASVWPLLILLAAAVASGIHVAYQTNEVRRLHAEMQAMQRTQDELLSEYSRLLLERSTLAAFQNVERIAQTELAMQFPETMERLEP